ncbi:hypothetical protein SAMN05216349_10360 [Oribacterium sp. KHPX15]|uniref:hypothetical protein n=1 Tax=unclassified Oribacterium TaxID=2629782 RepID=UPI0004E13E96|nr:MULTISPECIES: hypothetical protein [unclassified Oribacterium]SDZ96807.1 hypothetical protein SAMN05216349_10360 [Oribacterium sp. KHPX15]
MNSVFLDNETISFLADIYARKEIDKETILRNSKKLEEIFKTEGDANNNQDDNEYESSVSMSQILIETYIRSSVRVVVEFHKKHKIVKRGYYFDDDLIVLLEAYRDGGEFLWLPTIKNLMGSLAYMISDQIIECGNEEFKGSLKVQVNEGNYMDCLIKGVTEERYQNLLKEDRSQDEYLWIRGISSIKGENCFAYVIFKNHCAFYFYQDNSGFCYGCADRSTIVNIIGKWMLFQHRELIVQMQEKEV